MFQKYVESAQALMNQGETKEKIKKSKIFDFLMLHFVQQINVLLLIHQR